jgi:hypothetical protein
LKYFLKYSTLTKDMVKKHGYIREGPVAENLDRVAHDIPPVNDEVFEEIPGDEVFEEKPEHDDENAMFEEIPDPMLDGTSLLDVPPIHHIIDNATNSLAQHMPHYSDVIKEGQALCKMCGRLQNRTRLLERCFDSALGKTFHKHFYTFRGRIYPGRWGSIVHAMPYIIAIKGFMQWGWDLDSYMRGAEEKLVDGETSLTELVDAAVKSVFFGIIGSF